jgi:hypothetical protein
MPILEFIFMRAPSSIHYTCITLRGILHTTSINLYIQKIYSSEVNVTFAMRTILLVTDYMCTILHNYTCHIETCFNYFLFLQ